MDIQISSTNPIALAMLKNAKLDEGISVVVPPIREKRDISESWNIALFTVAASIPTGVIIGLILKHFGKDPRTTKITINRKEIEYSEGEMVRVIEETQKIEKG